MLLDPESTILDRLAGRFSFPRARARAYGRAITLVGVLVLAAFAAAAAATTTPTLAAAPAAGAATPVQPIAPLDAFNGRWFALGANLPWIDRGCDFGCGRTRGVRANRDKLDVIFRDMSRRGVRVVRWELFPNDAWQVQRTADGTPTAVNPAVVFDMEVALTLAERNDVFLLPVLFPDPDSIPRSWITDPAQSAALGAALRPLFARYRNHHHLFGWEVVTGAERLADTALATREQLRLHAAGIIEPLRAAAPTKNILIGPSDITRIDVWTGLRVDAYDPQHITTMSGDACATCRAAADVRAAEAADAPIMIGGFDAPSDDAASTALDAYVRQGYAGALAWSWRGVPHPDRPGEPTPMPDDATWRLHYLYPTTGPRSRPLNPCYGPDEASFRCPNLRMSRPADVALGHRGRRSILYSTNSLDSRGTGPASLRGRRDSQFTMAARQVLHRVNDTPVLIDTGAKLLFKAVPGQYRYWKWNGAARMELWRLNAAGDPVERTKIGPKTVYCLRDLQRRFGRLPGSPRRYHFPGCSQRLSQQTVTLGTSVGWSDVYPSTYHENWIDVTGLRGCFAYVHVADPTNVIYESNEDDNASSVVVKLPWTGSNRGCPGAQPIPTIGPNGTY
ncbi:MAG: hypothetical protein JWL76_1597 [Thermoleophilia bacterium]|nr:hypothetical protein [Thermoleophilia bacterium]